MRKITFAVIELLLGRMHSEARCKGQGAFQTCSDVIKFESFGAGIIFSLNLEKRCSVCNKDFERLQFVFKGQSGSKVGSAKDHLVVVDSFSNTMLSGINAPTEANLEDWLKAHSSYYVVLPSEVSPKMFYG